MIYKILVLFFCFASAAAQMGRMVGGIKTLDISTEETRKRIDKLVEFGLDQLAKRRMAEKLAADSTLKESSVIENPLKYVAVETTDVRTQVVAGLNYFIKVKINEANCTDNCDIEECELTIWDKPWENFKNLTDFKCKKQAIRFGGRRKISPSNREAIKALHYAVFKMNQASNDLFYSKPVKVDKVFKQIVNGIKYTIVFKIAPTECKKNSETVLSHTELNECAASDVESKSMNCKVVVLDKPWLNESKDAVRYNVMNQDCSKE